MMLPAGDATGGAIRELAELLDADDIAVDGGNSHYKDDVERSKWLGKRGIHFVDCGTSGGIWGETRGYA
jgi:6-phosphogluconate dehydrogenase